MGQKRKPVENDERPSRRRYAGGTPGGAIIKRTQSLRSRFPIMPLEHMLGILNEPDLEVDPDDELSWKRAANQAVRKDEMAKAAAPYVHPRLSAIEFNDKSGDPRSSLDLTKLSDEELAAFELIVSKSQVQLGPVELDGDDPDVGMKLISYDPSIHKTK
jgi:hypothetical protein